MSLLFDLLFVILLFLLVLFFIFLLISNGKSFFLTRGILFSISQGKCDIRVLGCDNRTALALASHENMHSVVKRLLDIYDTKDTNDSKAEASAESCEAGQILEGEFIEEPMHEVTGQFYFYCHVVPGYRKFSITVFLSHFSSDYNRCQKGQHSLPNIVPRGHG